MSVKDVWVRAVPPSQKITAAYLTIVNGSDEEIVLESASSEAAASVEIHEMKSQDGMMAMQRLPQLSVAAGSESQLKPGGIHLMLIGLRRPLTEGEPVLLKLMFGGGLELVVQAEVKR